MPSTPNPSVERLLIFINRSIVEVGLGLSSKLVSHPNPALIQVTVPIKLVLATQLLRGLVSNPNYGATAAGSKLQEISDTRFWF